MDEARDMMGAGAATVAVLIGEGFGWTRLQGPAGTLFVKGHVLGATAETLLRDGLAAAAAGRDAASTWLAGLDGHFALVVQSERATLAAVDRVRSIPLVHARDGATVLVAELGDPVVERLGLGPADADPDAVLAVALSGFTIGDDTLYPAARQIGPGQFLLADGDGAGIGRYHRWAPWAPADIPAAELIGPLSDLNRRVIAKLVDGLGGRQVLVPLSAGLDSRFVAAGLKAAGYDNVTCFSYGQPGNHEAATAREVARRLGYDWHFLPYSRATQRAAMTGPAYARFEAMSDSLTGVHFPQEFLAFEQLTAQGIAAGDAVVVNGQAGDFIAGNHIPPALFAPDGPAEARRARLLVALVAKHYRLWQSLTGEAALARIRARLGAEIDALGGLPDDPAGDHGIYEYCEFQDRQSKYVLNGQRHYEFFGFDWRLPLWDRDYMDFWAAAPLSAKRHQSLYREVLMRDDWGGVWQDIPVNAKTIQPPWIRPIRWAAKALHAPLGRPRWHAFERRYLQYWMSNTCTYAKWPWREVVADGRGHWNPISFHVAAYLASHGWGFDRDVRLLAV